MGDLGPWAPLTPVFPSVAKWGITQYLHCLDVCVVLGTLEQVAYLPGRGNPWMQKWGGGVLGPQE